MESMALHLESAYERLYRWTQSESKTLYSEVIMTIATMMFFAKSCCSENHLIER